MKITVKEGKEVWKSPDGKVKIYDITLDNGTIMHTKSDRIAGGGEFDVEVYEKNNKTYVRQLPKEGNFSPSGKTFKADPEKMKQEWTLEVARNQSIQRQVAYKGVIDLVVSDKIELGEFELWFDLSMNFLANPWNKEAVQEAEDQPPVEVYEGIPH